MGFFDFLSGIGDVFGQISQLVSELFAFLWAALSAALNFLWSTLVSLANTIASVFRNVGSFFARMWTDYVKPAIRGLFNDVIKLFDRLNRLLAPLIKWIQKIRKWYDTHILPILLKEIQMIQRVRQFLAVLRVLHVKWATVLDQKLQDIQGKIIQTVEIVRQKLNEISNFFTILTNPLLLAGSLPHATWLVQFLDTTLRALGGIGLGWFVGYKNRTGISAGKTLPFNAITNEMKQDTRNGTGDFSRIRKQAQFGWGSVDSQLR
jgi:hypothetical protein